MIWIFEKNHFHEGNSKKMKDLADSMGHETYWVDYSSLGDSICGLPDYTEFLHFKCEQEPVVTYGSVDFIKYIKKNYPNWCPSSWFDQEKLTYHYLYGSVGRYCLNQEYIMFPIKDAPRIGDFLFSTLNKDKLNSMTPQIFIFLDSFNDYFDSKVVETGQLEAWCGEKMASIGRDQCPLAVATPAYKVPEKWRAVIGNGKVITASKYLDGSKWACKEDMDEKMIEYAEHVVKQANFQPFPVMCLDVCRLETGVFRILHAGSINTSGLFSCNLQKVFDFMTEQAIIEHKKKHAA